jgi:uncharacterized membrane protein YhaH (DUF805 family)
MLSYVIVKMLINAVRIHDTTKEVVIVLIAVVVILVLIILLFVVLVLVLVLVLVAVLVAVLVMPHCPGAGFNVSHRVVLRR